MQANSANQENAAVRQGPVNPAKVMMRAGISLLLIVAPYVIARLFPQLSLPLDMLEAFVAIGGLLVTLWAVQATGGMRTRFFYLFAGALIVAPILAYLLKTNA